MITIAKTQVALDFYRQMHKRILLGKFANNKIPGVRQLAEEAGVSVPSVMEGIDLLEDRNVVWRRQGSGIYVNTLDKRQLSVTVLQSDYPSPRFEMLNRAVAYLCEQRGYCFCRKIISSSPNDIGGLPDFSDVIVYIAPSHALKPLWLAEVEARCGMMILMDKCPGYLALDTISIDGENMVLQALNYLYNKGHRHIWYLHNSPNVYDVIIRYFAAARWAVDHDVKLEHIDCGIKPGDDGYAQALEVVTPRLKGAKVKPTAMLAINDVGSLMAKQACADAGLAVPNDVSIVGLSDCPEAEAAQLTVVADRQEDFIEALDSLIRKRLYEKCGEIMNISITGVLIERKSVKHI